MGAHVPARYRTVLSTALLCLAAALPAAAADLERGEQLYALCQQCHGAQGTGNPDALAPAIGGMPEWYVTAQLGKFRDGIRGTHFDDIGGMRMRPMSLWLTGDEDIAAVAAYVAQLPVSRPEKLLPPGDAAQGAALYAICQSCHGADAAGQENPPTGDQYKGAPLRNQSDWYLAKQIKNFQQGVRGSDPRDNAVQMRGMVAVLATDEAIRNVIAHIQTLDK